MDDEDGQEPGGVSGTATPKRAHATNPTSSDEPTAAKPLPKPEEPATNAAILKEAFPGVEEPVIKAVLRASGDRVEAAFNALLEMSDPDAVKNEPEVAAPTQRSQSSVRNDMSQVEADELYARKLAEQYDNVGAYEARTSNRSREPRHRRVSYEEEREHNFIDDDLPVIRDNLRKGFLETQKQVNGWITNFRKKIEENLNESDEPSQPNTRPSRRQGEASRRSGDYERYDADPQVLSDDFAGMKFTSDGSLANQRPHKASGPVSSDGRRVSFKERHENDIYDAPPQTPPKDKTATALPTGSSGKTSKWQPLSTVEPSPIAEHDPFSLGDSEDERDAKDKDSKAKDGKADEEERLKKALAEAANTQPVQPVVEDDAVKKKG